MYYFQMAEINNMKYITLQVIIPTQPLFYLFLNYFQCTITEKAQESKNITVVCDSKVLK